MDNSNKLVVIVMAGGLGKRMNSDIPKVLHKISGIPMIVHILSELKVLNQTVEIEKILIVVGKYKREITETIQNSIYLDKITYILQPEPLGTGNAIQCCRDELLKYPNTNTLILSGDVPMLTSNTMFNTVKTLKSIVRIIVTKLDDPTGYGRIIEKNNKFDKIIEEKDCSKEELDIKKVNCGIYAINTEILCKYLPFITNHNAQREYYLTDIIEIIKNGEKKPIELLEIDKSKQIEILGVNTIEQLKDIEYLKSFNYVKKLC
jgi:UDP-N-acetylglucosamine diphosphorylase/glucosamine-1-phosphate N-acetyltransferase